MFIGIDYSKTISKYPKTFRKLSESLTAQGHTVYIISAVTQSNAAQRRKDIKKSKVPHTRAELIIFKDHAETPQLKLEACKRLGVRLMFDDREETCQLLAEHGILTCQVR